MKDMMNSNAFFCDTYALIEIIGGNKDYKKYENATLVTSEFNLIELYYHFLKNYSRNNAEHYFSHWLNLCVHIPHTAIKSGMEIKLAARVTKREPKIKGSIPNWAGSEIGYQFLPKSNLFITITTLGR